jgi:3'-phosphoadenosine 5'-phosphosulfate sulfotransferase (PAPS reductase)/FAD synthetase
MLGMRTKKQTIKANIPEKDRSTFSLEKYKFFLDCPFEISNRCCTVMKKEPSKRYSKETGRKPITATMASESRLRTQKWLQNGCNGFEMKSPISNPMSFWTEQDVLTYIYENDIKIAEPYGNIVTEDNQIPFAGCACTLCTTGCHRTGCIYCGFGAHLEKGEGRFERLKRTHPKQYDFCINGGAYDTDGIWKPDKRGLGMGHVFDVLNSLYGEDFIKYK